jgi:hypothetical protein
VVRKGVPFDVGRDSVYSSGAARGNRIYEREDWVREVFESRVFIHFVGKRDEIGMAQSEI